MKNYACPHCGSVDVFVKEKGTQTGLYCSDCTKWIKWISKNEIPFVERFIEEQKRDVCNIKTDEKVELDKDKILEQMCKQISDFIFVNYNPHTTVLITDSHIKLMYDEFGIPVKR